MSDLRRSGTKLADAPILARNARRRFGGGWEAGKRVAFFIILVLVMLVPLSMVEGVVRSVPTPSARWRRRSARNGARRRSSAGRCWSCRMKSRACRWRCRRATRRRSSRRAMPCSRRRNCASTPASGVQKRYKSIYEMLVYGADIAITGRFAAPDFAALGVTPTQIAWNSASLVLGISGVRAVNAVTLNGGRAATARSKRACCPIIPSTEGIRADTAAGYGGRRVRSRSSSISSCR